MLYSRDTQGRIVAVGTRATSGGSWVDVADDINYQPMSRIVQSLNYDNGLNDWNMFTTDHELDVLGVYDGSTNIINRSHTRTDSLNLTNVWDSVTAANNQSYWHTGANRLQDANGPWGAKTFYYDGVGNRTYHISTPSGGPTTTEVLDYPGGSNRVSAITVGATTVRQFAHDAAGNITSDTRLGQVYAYTYNKVGRMASITLDGTLKGTYTYNGAEQLVARVVTNSGTQNGTCLFARFQHDALRARPHGQRHRRGERLGRHAARVCLAARDADRSDAAGLCSD